MADKTISVSLDFTANTNQAESALKNLQSSLQNISNMSTIGQDARMAKSIEEASAAAMTLRNNLQAAFDQKTGSLNLSKLNEEMAKSGMSAEKYRTTLSAIGPQGRQAFMQLANAVVASETPLRQTTGLVDKLWDSLKRTAGWQLSSSMIHGFMGAIQSAYGYAQDLNKSLNNIRIVTGYSTDEMARFAEQANKAAKGLSSTTTDYTDAALIYYQQGIRDQKEIEGRVATTIKLANVSGQSAEEVSSQMTAIWNNFDDGSKSLEYYADVITALGAATASSSQEISQGLSKFAAVAETVGMSYEYATSALATIVATTRQSADTVGTGLRTLFSRLQGLKLGETLEDGVDLNKYSKALEAVGVKALDASGELRNMDEILDDLGERWGDLSQAQKVALAQTVGGVRQYTNLVALMDNWDFMKENVGIAEGAEGTLQEQADIYAESWEAAKNRVRAAAEGIYNDLLDDKFFINITKLFAGLLETIDKVIDAFGGLGGTLPLIFTLMNKIFGEKIQAGAQQLAENIYYSTNKGKAERDAKDAETKQSFVDQTKAMARDSGASANEASVMATGYEKITALQTEMIAKNKTLTEEERNLYRMAIERAQILTQQTAELGKQADKAQAAANKEKFDLMTGTEKTDANGKLKINQDFNNLNLIPNKQSQLLLSSTSNAGDTELVARELERILELGENSIQTVGQLQTAYEQFANLNLKGTLSQDLDQIIAKNKELASGQNLYEKVQQGLTSIQGTTDIEKARAELEELAKQAGATGEAIINDLGKKINPTMGDIEQAFIRLGAGVTKSNENIESNVKQLGQKIGQAYGFSKEEIEKFIQTTLEAAQAEKLSSEETERLKTSLQSLSTSAGQAGNSMSGTSQKIANVLGAANKFGQAAMNISMAVGAIRGISDALDSTDMSPLEKMMSIFMSMGMLIPIITSGINGFVGIIKAINGVTIISTGLTVAETMAQAGLAKAISESTKKDLERYATKMLCNGATQEEIAKDLEAILLKDKSITSINAETKALIENTAAKLANAQAGKGVNSNLGQEGADIVNQTLLGGGKSAGTNVAQGLFGNIKSKLSALGKGLKAGISKFLAWVTTTVGATTMIVTGIVLAAILAIVLIRKQAEAAYKDAQEKYDSAKKIQDAAEENYKKQNENYNNLKSMGDEYKSLKDSLRGLTQGTTEWYEATTKMNNIVSELVSQYPELAENLEVINGHLTLSNDDIEKVQKAQLRKVNQAQYGVNIAKQATLEAQKNLTTTSLAYDLTGNKKGLFGNKLYIDRNNESTHGRYVGDRTGATETMEDLLAFVQQHGEGVLEDTEQNRELLAHDLHLDSTDVDYIMENSQAVKDAMASIKKADASIEGLTEVNRQLLKDKFGEMSDEFANASEIVQDSVSGALQKNASDYIDYYQDMADDGNTDVRSKAVYWMNQNAEDGVSYKLDNTPGKNATIMVKDTTTGGGWKILGDAEENSWTLDDFAQIAAQQRAIYESTHAYEKYGDQFVKDAGAYSRQLSKGGIIDAADITSVVTGVLDWREENGKTIKDAIAANPQIMEALSKYNYSQLMDVANQMSPGGSTQTALLDYINSDEYRNARKEYSASIADSDNVQTLNAGYGVKKESTTRLGDTFDWGQDLDNLEESAARNFGDMLYDIYKDIKAAHPELSDEEALQMRDDYVADRQALYRGENVGTESQKELLDSASGYQQCAKEVKNLSDAILQHGRNSEEAAEAYEELKEKMDAIKWNKFAKDASKFFDTLRENSDPKEVEKALAGIAQSMNELLNISIDSAFVSEYKDLILEFQSALASGNEELALQKAGMIKMLDLMRDAGLTEETVFEFDANGDGVIEEFERIQGAYGLLQTLFANNLLYIDGEGRLDLTNLFEAVGHGKQELALLIGLMKAAGQSELDISGIISSDAKEILTDANVDFAHLTADNLPKMIEALQNFDGPIIEFGGHLAIDEFVPTNIPAAAMQRMGNGGGKGGGGGGSKRKNKDLKKTDRSTRYHTTKTKQDTTNRKQEDANRKKERAFGKESIEQAKNEIDLQKQKIALQKTYLQEIEKYLKEDKDAMQNAFSALNIQIKINDDGTIGNYEEAMKALLEQENALINQYNAGGLDDDAFEKANKKIEDAREALENYEETLQLQNDELQTMQEHLEKLADLALELTQKQVELDISINDDTMEYLDYMLSRIEDNAYRAAEAISLLGDQSKVIMENMSIYRAGLEDILNRKGISIDQLDKVSDEDLKNAGFTQAEVDQIREWRSALLEANQSLLDMRNNIIDKVINSFDELNDKVAESYELFNNYNSTLEHYKNITELMGTQMNKNSKEIINQLNQAMLDNSTQQLQSAKKIYNSVLKAQQDAQNAYNEAIKNNDEEAILKWKEILDDANEKVLDAQEQWQDAWQQAADNIQTIFETMIENIVQEFEQALSGAFGSLDFFSEAFSRASDMSEEYLKNYDRLYELNKLSRDINKTLSDTKGVANRKELIKLQNELNEYMKEGTHLSQYDLEALQKRYELQQAYYDLQAARNAKNRVSLARDNEGNWSYVYTANEDKVAEAEQQYEDKLNAYQKLNDDYIKELQEKALSIQETYRDTYKDIMSDMTLTDDERKARITELNDWLSDQQAYFNDQSQKVFANQASTLKDYEQIYGDFAANLVDTWEETSLANLTQLNTLEEYMQNWQTATKNYTDSIEQAFNQRANEFKKLADEDGYISNIDSLIKDIKTDSEETSKSIDILSKTMNDTFKNALAEAVNWEKEYVEKMKDMIDQNVKLANSLNVIIDRLRDIRSLDQTTGLSNNNYAAIPEDGNHPYLNNQNSKYDDYLSDLISSATGMASGGYTGDWNSNEGRIAILHEKEQVFNADDTKNLLLAAKVLQTIDLSVSRFAQGIGDLMLPTIQQGSETFEQSVHIEASFPNAVDHTEIEEAFNNLANKATQYANRKNG